MACLSVASLAFPANAGIHFRDRQKCAGSGRSPRRRLANVWQSTGKVGNASEPRVLHVERCRRESPYGAPIAHGYLIVSLLPMLFESSLRIDGLAMTVNYGLDRVRLPAPVLAGQRIRGRLALEKLDDVKSGMQAHWNATVEIENGDKPACVAQMLARYTPSFSIR
jgi:hypothetical protein